MMTAEETIAVTLFARAMRTARLHAKSAESTNLGQAAGFATCGDREAQVGWMLQINLRF